MLGKQVVVRKAKDGQYVLAAAPHGTSTNISEAQKEQRERFRRAVTYAKAAQSNPEYTSLAKSRSSSGYNVAMADFMHPPEVQGINLEEYKGEPGQRIIITAVDDVKVKTVGVLIATDEGVFIEKGTAVPHETEPNQWLYTTTARAPGSTVKVVVDVADLAGQVTEVTEHL
jgi:hypothetical protein